MDLSHTSTKIFLLATVLVVGLLITGAVVFSGSSSAPGTGSVLVDIKNVKIDGDPFIGQANAPVAIAFWSDFQCPYCKAFEVGGVEGISTPAALPDIIKNYVDTGKVKIVFKDVVFLSPRAGSDSLTGALYSLSVWKLYPDKYLTWRTAMFTAQDAEGSGFGNAASIDALNAKIPGLDAAKIAADVKANTDAYTGHANANTAESQSMGISATPSFIIGTKLISGAYPYATYQSAVDVLLK